MQTDIRGVESNVIYTIQQGLVTGLLYTDPEQLPYAITQYSPLFYVICVKLATALNLTPGTDVYKIYILCRLVSLLAALAISVLIYLTAVKQLGLTKTIGLLAAFLAFLIPVPWFFLARPDALLSLFLFAAVAAFLLYLNYWQTKPGRAIIWLGCSALLATLALFSKQNGFIILAGPALFLLLMWRLKDFALYSVFCGLFLMLGYFVLLKDTQLHLLHANLIKGVDNGIDLPAFFKKVVFVYLSEFAFLVTLTAALLVFAVRQKGLIRQASIPIKFIGFFFLLVTAFSFLSALKYGSAHNYVVDSLLLSLFLIGYAGTNVASLQEAAYNPVVRLFGIIAFSIFVLRFSVQNFYVYAGKGAINAFYNRTTGYDAEVKLAGELEKELQQYPGAYYFSLNRNINNHLFRYVVFPQSEMAANPHQQKVFDYNNFGQDVAAGKIKFLLLPQQEAPVRFAGESLTGYSLYKANTLHGNLYIWQSAKPDSVLSGKLAFQK